MSLIPSESASFSDYLGRGLDGSSKSKWRGQPVEETSPALPKESAPARKYALEKESIQKVTAARRKVRPVNRLTPKPEKVVSKAPPPPKWKPAPFTPLGFGVTKESLTHPILPPPPPPRPVEKKAEVVRPALPAKPKGETPPAKVAAKPVAAEGPIAAPAKVTNGEALRSSGVKNVVQAPVLKLPPPAPVKPPAPAKALVPPVKTKPTPPAPSAPVPSAPPDILKILLANSPAPTGEPYRFVPTSAPPKPPAPPPQPPPEPVQYPPDYEPDDPFLADLFAPRKPAEAAAPILPVTPEPPAVPENVPPVAPSPNELLQQLFAQAPQTIAPAPEPAPANPLTTPVAPTPEMLLQQIFATAQPASPEPLAPVEPPPVSPLPPVSFAPIPPAQPDPLPPVSFAPVLPAQPEPLPPASFAPVPPAQPEPLPSPVFFSAPTPPPAPPSAPPPAPAPAPVQNFVPAPVPQPPPAPVAFVSPPAPVPEPEPVYRPIPIVRRARSAQNPKGEPAAIPPQAQPFPLAARPSQPVEAPVRPNLELRPRVEPAVPAQAPPPAAPVRQSLETQVPRASRPVPEPVSEPEFVEAEAAWSEEEWPSVRPKKSRRRFRFDWQSRFVRCMTYEIVAILVGVITAWIGLRHRMPEDPLNWLTKLLLIASAVVAALIPVLFYGLPDRFPRDDR